MYRASTASHPQHRTQHQKHSISIGVFRALEIRHEYSDQLFDAISTQIKLPPRPLLYIQGTHRESSKNKKDKNNTVTDFEFRLDLAESLLTGWEDGRAEDNWMRLEILNDEDQKSAYRGGILPSRNYKPPKQSAVHLSEDSDALLGGEQTGNQDQSFAEKSLRLWCQRFCHDPAPVKSYCVRPSPREKEVTNIRTDSPSTAN